MMPMNKALFHKLNCNRSLAVHPSYAIRQKNGDGRNKLMGILVKNSKSPVKNESPKTATPVQNATISPLKIPMSSILKRKDEASQPGSPVKKPRTETQVSSDGCSEPSIAIGSSKSGKPRNFNPSRTYVCKFCCRRFLTLDLLKEHLSTAHVGKQVHACYLCGHQAATFSSLMTHYLRHSGTKGSKVEKIYAKSKADFCNIKFNVASRPKTTIRCVHCKLPFSSKEKFNAHHCLSQNKKNEYNCAYCGKVSTSVEEYRDHVLSHSVTPFLCTFCGAKFPTKKRLDRHCETCLKAPKRGRPSLKCPKCKVQCKKKFELNDHIESCTGPPPPKVYKCNNCDKLFVREKKYENHIKSCLPPVKEPEPVILSPESPEPEYTCHSCPSKFHNRSEMEIHAISCPMSYPTKSGTKSRAKSRSISPVKSRSTSPYTSAPFTTPVKSESIVADEGLTPKRRSARLVDKKQFSSSPEEVEKREEVVVIPSTRGRKPRKAKCKAEVVVEKVVEEEIEEVEEEKVIEEKPKKAVIKTPKKVLGTPAKGKKSPEKSKKVPSFFCNHCNFSFCSKSSLIRHKRMHSGNPWFTCKYCGKFFFRKDVFIRHEMNVHSKSSKEVLCCCYCKMYFNVSSVLKEHVLATHRANAFFTVKPYRKTSSGEQDETRPLSSIKSELLAEIDANASEDSTLKSASEFDSENPLKIGNLEQSAYQCGICLGAFESVAQLKEHFTESHPSTEAMNSEETADGDCSESVILQIDDVVKLPEVQSMKALENAATNETPTKKVQRRRSGSVHMKSFECEPKPDSQQRARADSMQEEEPVLLPQEKPGLIRRARSNSSHRVRSNSSQEASSKYTSEMKVDDVSDDDLTDVSESFEDVVKQGEVQTVEMSFACKLCLKSFASQLVLNAHMDTNHRLIEWYQCLVCDFSGPKKDMQEHMLTHMYKVGMFVVNSERKNFDPILPYLPQFNPGVESVSAKSGNEQKNSASNAPECEKENEVTIESQLPPLKDMYGNVISSKPSNVDLTETGNDNPSELSNENSPEPSDVNPPESSDVISPEPENVKSPEPDNIEPPEPVNVEPPEPSIAEVTAEPKSKPDSVAPCAEVVNSIPSAAEKLEEFARYESQKADTAPAGNNNSILSRLLQFDQPTEKLNNNFLANESHNSDALDLSGGMQSASSTMETVNDSDLFQCFNHEVDLFDSFDYKDYCLESNQSFSELNNPFKSDNVYGDPGTASSSSAYNFAPVKDTRCNECHYVFNNNDELSRHICSHYNSFSGDNTALSSCKYNDNSTNIFQSPKSPFLPGELDIHASNPFQSSSSFSKPSLNTMYNNMNTGVTDHKLLT